MKSLFKIKAYTWTLLVSFMIAWHNVYFEENKMPNSIVIEIVEDNIQGDNTDFE